MRIKILRHYMGTKSEKSSGKITTISSCNESHICELRRKVKMTKRMGQTIIGHSPKNRGYVWILFARTKSDDILEPVPVCQHMCEKKNAKRAGGEQKCVCERERNGPVLGNFCRNTCSASRFFNIATLFQVKFTKSWNSSPTLSQTCARDYK